MDKMASDIVKSFKSYGKAVAMVRGTLQGEAGDARLILQQVTDKLIGDESDDGKRIYASFRSTVSREAKALNLVVSFAKGAVTISERADLVESTVKAVEAPNASKVPDVDGSEKEADAVWLAVDVVLANLGNPAVLSAIKSGLESLAKGK